MGDQFKGIRNSMATDKATSRGSAVDAIFVGPRARVNLTAMEIGPADKSAGKIFCVA
jgi:hypothetical protein